MGTKTGKGGFEIDGQTYTFDRVEPGEPGIEPSPVDKGDIAVDETVTDIGETTKITIGQYLSDRTNEEKNDFPIDRVQEEAKITDEKGFPVNPSEHPNSAKFSDFMNAAGQVNDSDDLRSFRDQALDDPATKIAFQKGKKDAELDNGNDVLPSVQRNALPDSINPYVSSVLSNNRFSDAATAYGETNLDRPGAGFNTTLTHPEFGEISSHRLAQVGVALSIRSSAELNAATRGNNPSGGGSEAKALLPSLNQLGTSRVNLTELEALDVLRTLTEDEIDDNNLTNIAVGGSWGSLNNVHDHFSGITSIGMIALSVALTAAVLVLYEGLGFVISLINGPPAAPGKSASGARTLGSSIQQPSGQNPNSFPPSFPPDISSLLSIRPTVNSFGTSLEAGTAAFFGVDNSGGLVGQVLGAVDSSLENPGFNSIVARTILRAGVTIIDAFKDVGGNPVSVVKGILNIIDVIRTSKIIGAMNVFAQLGDQLLIDENIDETVDSIPVKKSRIDKIPDNAFAASVRKSRLTDIGRNGIDAGLKLAWANNRAPSSYLLPDSVSVLALLSEKLGAPQNVFGLHEDKARVFYKRLSNDEIESNGARIPYDGDSNVTVKKMEALLEGEYMPFYFQDLRTNEIIGFHAFLTALTDDYNANWETTDSFGRVDPVKIYRNTTRRISIGWYIISTSDEDFNDMWFKINKLVTLVYPQYTKGRTLITERSTITQPFSQLQGASPLIRLRLGDLFKSNYSRFALARLFGAGDGEFKFNDQTLNLKSAQAALQDIKTKVDQLRKSAVENGKSDKKWMIMVDELPTINEASLKVSLPVPLGLGGGSSSDETAPVFRVNQADLKFFEFDIVGKGEEQRTVHIRPGIMQKQTMIEQFGMSEEEAGIHIKNLEDLYDDSNKNSGKKVVGGTYVINSSLIVPSYQALKEIKNDVASAGGASAEGIKVFNEEFMNPAKNALVRAFQETRGRGLAGTIDSLNFDFYDNVTWDTSPGQRAPRMMKVTISFTPIHDISPGIDHTGFNRAPIYPVGHLAHTKDDVKEVN